MMNREKKIFSLEEIFNNAKANSPYYKDLFKEVTFSKLEALPLTNQDEFWKKNKLMTDSGNGIVFKSGGSTGAPKYSYFTHDEWKTFTSYFGEGMSRGILQNGDRVGNLFYVGDLYASFLFIKDSLQAIDPEFKSITQYPIAGATDFINILQVCDEFKINVLAGVPTQILKLLEYYESNKKDFKNFKITKILFGGESLYPDQENSIKEIFPEIQISSIGCASVDGGLIGFSSVDCARDEHRVFDHATIIEIIDPDTLEVIHEKNRLGKILLTNLSRKLMPIIRYPAGDMAMWLEDENENCRKFKLMGRADEGARLGTMTIYFEDTRKLVLDVLKEFTGVQFQLKINHFSNKDELTMVISGHELFSSDDLEKQIIDSFISEKRTYIDLLSKSLIHPIKISIVDANEMETNKRTGKLKRIIDLRMK